MTPLVAVVRRTRAKVKWGIKASDKWKSGIKSNNAVNAIPIHPQHFSYLEVDLITRTFEGPACS